MNETTTRPCRYCGLALDDKNVLTDLRIFAERLGLPGGPTVPTAYLHVNEQGFVHLHGWVMYAPSEDRLSRHVGRAVRRRLPGWLLRTETALRRKWGAR